MPAGGSSAGAVAPAALVDTHAHFYDCYELGPFLEAASRNLDRAERELDPSAPSRPQRVLLIMESEGRSLVERLLAESSVGDWRAEPVAEPGALALTHPDRAPLLLVEGRQVVTAERLEVLAAPCATDLPIGAPLGETLDAVTACDAVPILPWGFGKWWGKRGRRISTLLEQHRGPRPLLSDNGGRFGLGGVPRLLTLGAQRGFPVVCGSDPLALASDASRVGSYGSVLHGPFDATLPASSSRRLLRGLDGQPRSFGGTVGPVKFLINQIGIRARRRRS